MRKISFIASIIIIIVSIILYTTKNAYWYYPGVIGVWLLFDNFSYLQKNKTTLDLLIKKNYKKFLFLYMGLFILGFFIEIIGRFLLKVWDYPLANPLITNTIGFLFWPFILMSFKETYSLFDSLTKNKICSVLISMLVGIIIWEVPNIYSGDWIYKIPFVSLEIFNLNVIIIIGWSVLILGPIYIYKKLDLKV